MGKANILALACALALAAGCIAAQPEQADEDAQQTPSPTPTVAACEAPDVETTGGPGGQATVSNVEGAFSYSGQVVAHTAREVYVWENPSSAALFSWGGQSAGGLLMLTVQDACGIEVYSVDLGGMRQGSVSEETRAGERGAWILTFEFTAYTGQMGLSLTMA